MAKLVSQVYAEALFGLGVENGLLDTLSCSWLLISSSLSSG